MGLVNQDSPAWAGCSSVDSPYGHGYSNFVDEEKEEGADSGGLRI